MGTRLASPDRSARARSVAPVVCGGRRGAFASLAAWLSRGRALVPGIAHRDERSFDRHLAYREALARITGT